MSNLADLVVLTLGFMIAACCISSTTSCGGQSAVLTRTLSEEQVNGHFEKFKIDFNRTYPNPEEHRFRKRVFADNLERIFRHNVQEAQGLHSYTMGVNQFTDITSDEFRERYIRPYSRLTTTAQEHVQLDRPDPLPVSVDWTEKGVVTALRQLFASARVRVTRTQTGNLRATRLFLQSVAAIESQVAIKTGKLVELSEQQIVDCSSASGNDGCDAGFVDKSYNYLVKQGGLDTEQSYPYKGVASPSCQYNPQSVGAQLDSFQSIKRDSESDLQAALAQIGPVSVALSVDLVALHFYQSGIVDGCCFTEPNLAVTLVGYGVTEDNAQQQYYKAKISYGTDFGEKGYVRIPRNQGNLCMVARYATVPTLKNSTVNSL